MMSSSSQIRTYKRSQSVVFFKTKEAFGGLSNMASGFPLRVNGVHIHTSEALYQACRFPHLPEMQRKIIAEHSPMTAKMRSKPYRSQSRLDWDSVRTKIMRWCLRVKLVQNWKTFGDLLLSTGDRPIVEQSRKDDFWGAKEADDGILIGMNVLGRLLMELREELKCGQGDGSRVVQPLPIPDFLLFERPIQAVFADIEFQTSVTALASVAKELRKDIPGVAEQPSFFDASPAFNQFNGAVRQNDGGSGILAVLKPYPSYKPSTLKWLECLPTSWSYLRGKSIFSVVDVRSKTGKEELLTVSATNGVIPRRYTNVTMFKAKSYIGHKLCWPNDFVVNSLWAWMQGLGISRHHGLISSAYSVYRARSDFTNYARFFDYLVRSSAYKWELQTRSKGVWLSRLQLSDQAFMDMPVLLPPPEEQAGIVRFLDHATRRIDKAIQAKRRVIALLNEQKRSIIGQTVAHGLCRNASCQEPGIPWLRKIPAHWSVSRLKFEASHIVDCLHATPNYAPDGAFPAIRTADIEPGKVRLSQTRKLSLEEFNRWTARLVPREGDILYSREGERFGIAALVPRNVRLCISQRMMVFRIKERQCSEYVMWQLNCPHIYAQASADIIGSTSPHVNIEQIKNFRLALPPLSEQEEIVAEIRSQTSNIDSIVATSEQEISLLREYRTRLIADVVTGKIDVRAAAAQLPDDVSEAEEPIPADEGEETEVEDALLAGAANG